MNSKTSLYIMAILAVMTLLALPPASAAEEEGEAGQADANADTVEAARESLSSSSISGRGSLYCSFPSRVME